MHIVSKHNEALNETSTTVDLFTVGIDVVLFCGVAASWVAIWKYKKPTTRVPASLLKRAQDPSFCLPCDIVKRLMHEPSWHTSKTMVWNGQLGLKFARCTSSDNLLPIELTPEENDVLVE